MSAYYNEIDPFAAAWLRELIKVGLITDGEVDERSIEDVRPEDLRGFTRCHFFAGIGGWDYALRLARWGDGPVWTGSCPCQPLSCAGQRKAHADKRHLWPAFYRLIAECQPSMVFGEQVASKDAREWFSGVRADLEGVGYACGGADLCAASVGAPHIRQRLYWVAHTEAAKIRTRFGEIRARTWQDKTERFGDNSSCFQGMEHPDRSCEHGWSPSGQQSLRDERNGSDEELGNATRARLQEQRSEYRPSGERCSGLAGFAVQVGVPEWNGSTVAVECSDGWRRASAQPNAFPVAHGVPKRMGKLRGAGNAIVPQVAAAFIESVMEAIEDANNQ